MSRLPALGPRGEGWVVIQFLLLGLVVLAGVAGPTYAGPLSTAARVAGFALVAAGIVLAARGLLDLRDALTPLPHPRHGAELVDTGSYRLVRHPIYGGIVLAAAGYAMVVGSPLALAGAAISRLLPSQVRTRGGMAAGALPGLPGLRRPHEADDPLGLLTLSRPARAARAP